jgi:hypothetical protein
MKEVDNMSADQFIHHLTEQFLNRFGSLQEKFRLVNVDA